MCTASPPSRPSREARRASLAPPPHPAAAPVSTEEHAACVCDGRRTMGQGRAGRPGRWRERTDSTVVARAGSFEAWPVRATRWRRCSACAPSSQTRMALRRAAPAAGTRCPAAARTIAGPSPAPQMSAGSFVRRRRTDGTAGGGGTEAAVDCLLPAACPTRSARAGGCRAARSGASRKARPPHRHSPR